MCPFERRRVGFVWNNLCCGLEHVTESGGPRCKTASRFLRSSACFVECGDRVEREKGGSFVGAMKADRTDGRTPNQLRPLSCTHSLLHRAHGSAQWSQGDTIVLAAVYGPKAGIRKGENPEKASIEVVWKPKTGQIGKAEKEYEMILRRTLQSICLLTVHPNTTTSVILQVVSDDGALLPCAINASCAALVDAGIPLKHLAVAVSCGLTENGYFFLDPSREEELKMQAHAYLVFPNLPVSILPDASSCKEDQPIEHGIITSVSYGAMSVNDYLSCLERGRAVSAKISDFFRRNLQ